MKKILFMFIALLLSFSNLFSGSYEEYMAKLRTKIVNNNQVVSPYIQTIKVTDDKENDNKISIRKKSNNQNDNKVIDNTDSTISEKKTTSIMNDISIIKGNTTLNDNIDIGIVTDYMMNNITDEDIIKVRKKKELFLKTKNRPINKISLKSKRIDYNIFDGLSETIYIKMGYSTDIEFYDQMNQPLEIEGISNGNNIFDLSKPKPNILTIIPTVKYYKTDLKVRVKGYKHPIIFEIIEGDYRNKTDLLNIVDSNVIVTVMGESYDNSSDYNFKSQLLKEIYQYKTLSSFPSIGYEVYDMKEHKLKYFDKSKLQIYNVKRMGKEYIIVQLNNKYEILGESSGLFNRYSSANRIYFFNHYKESFIVQSKLNIIMDSESFEYNKDRDLAEKYRIVMHQH